MKKKDIIYITPALPIGGAEKFMLALSKSLIPFAGKQSIVNLSSVDVLVKEIDPAVAYVPLGRQSKYDIKPLKAFRKKVKEEKPDVLFCINFFTYFFVRIALLGMRRQPRVIISYHSTKQLTSKERKLHRLYTAILRKKDLIVCVSNNQKKFTQEKYNIKDSQIMTILNSVDTNLWAAPSGDQTKKEMREKLGIPYDAKVLILSAAFRPEKNHVGAIEALQILHQKYKQEVYLLCVGDGVMRPEIEAKMRELNLEKYVKLAGAQTYLIPYLHAADYFTLCSNAVETFSIAALEAMSTGLPLLMTNIGGANEMVNEPLNGLLMPTTSEGMAGYWNKALGIDFNRTAIRKYAIENFRIEKMTAEYLKVLQRD